MTPASTCAASRSVPEVRGVWCQIQDQTLHHGVRSYLPTKVNLAPGTPGQDALYPALGPGPSGLTKMSYALIDHLRSVDKRRVQRVFGLLAPNELRAVDDGLALFLGFSDRLAPDRRRSVRKAVAGILARIRGDTQVLPTCAGIERVLLFPVERFLRDHGSEAAPSPIGNGGTVPC